MIGRVAKFLRKSEYRAVTHNKKDDRSSRKRCRSVNESSINNDFRNFSKQSATNSIFIKVSSQQHGHGNTRNEHTNTRILKEDILETIGWSSTLALGWTISQHILQRSLRPFEKQHKRIFTYDQIQKFYKNRQPSEHHNYCPVHILKNNVIVQISAQPTVVDEKDDLKKTNIQDHEEATSSQSLPVYGPKTAEESLEDAVQGMKDAHYSACGDIENRLGLKYMYRRRFRKAISHFAAGSAFRNNMAIFNLGQCYELGLGTTKSFEKAAKCYKIASDRGHAAATYNLAVFYAYGYGGLESNKDKAFELIEKASELGEPAARNLLNQNRKKKPKKTDVEVKEDKPQSKDWIECQFSSLTEKFSNITDLIMNKAHSFSWSDEGVASASESDPNCGFSPDHASTNSPASTISLL